MPKKPSNVVNPKTGLSWAGRTMKGEVIGHLAAIASKFNNALKQLDNIPHEAGAKNAYHRPVDIIRSDIQQAQQIMSHIPSYVDELEEKDV